MTDSTKTTKPVRLPVWRTVHDAYAETFRHLGAFVRMAWLWLLVLTALVALASWFLFPLHEMWLAAGNVFSPAQIATSLISIVAGSSIAVAWHRLMLRQETPSGAAYLRLDGTVGRYLVAATAMAMPFFLPVYIVPATAVDVDSAASASVVGLILMAMPVLVFIAGLYLVTRLGPILPAIALERRDVTLRKVWAATTWNWWRLFLGLLLTGAVPVILSSVPFVVRDWDADPQVPPTLAAFVRSSLETELISFLSGIFAISFLSFAFRHFFGATAVSDGK